MNALLIALLALSVLLGLRARADVYGAFVEGAREGLRTLAGMAPYLAAVMTATALLRASGATDALCALLARPLSALGVPPEAAPALLLRPLSGSAALSEARALVEALGPESRAARYACIVCGASETVFFTGALYFGAAGVKRARYAIPAAMLGYIAGALCAVLFI